MSIFSNPFFSIAGQVERIKNVGATLNAAFNPFAEVKGVTSNTGNATADKILSTIASHPYVSAGIAAGGITAIKNPVATINVIKNIVTPKTAVGKVAALVATPLVAGVAIQTVKNKPTETFEAVVSAPNKLFQAGQDLSDLGKEPSLDKGIQFVKEHPYFTSGALLTALVALGFTTASALSIISNYQNTKAVNKNTEATDKSMNDSNTGNPVPNSGGGSGPTFIYNITPPDIPATPSLPNTAVVAPPTTTAEVAPAVVSTITKNKVTKKKAKKKVTKKKKTRRSKKKPKKKSINRRKTKK